MRIANEMRGKGMRLFNNPIFHVAAIIFLAVLVYSNTLDAPFQFDDRDNIVRNPQIKDLRYFSDPELINRSASHKQLFKSRYIGYLTFALNYSVHGLNVKGYHLVNICIHVLNSLLLYWFMKLTFSAPFFSASGGRLFFSEGSRNFVALFAALLFAVHPLQTQAVTYIVQRFTSLAALFYLFSLVLYVKWRERREQQAKRSASGALLYAGSLLSAVLAMKTKELAFTLPVVLALYEVLFFDGKIAKKVFSLAPFFLAVLLIPLALADTEGSLAALSGINEEAVSLVGERASISRGDYLLTQCRVIVTYIRLLLFPVSQNIDYDYPIFHSILSPEVVFSFLFLLSVLLSGVYLYRLSKRSGRNDGFLLRLISFGIFWFFITLSAESAVVPIIDVIFEHRVYLPSIGFFIAFMAAIGAGRERWGDRIAYLRKAAVYVVFTAVLALSGAAYVRNEVWNDSVTLWRNALEGSPHKVRPRANLGLAYAEQGRTEEAIQEFKASLRLLPYLVEVHYNLGVAYAAQGRIDEAVKEYVLTVMLFPGHAQAHNNLGFAYMDQCRTDDAIREFQAAWTISPDCYPSAPQFIDMLQKKKLAGHGCPSGNEK